MLTLRVLMSVKNKIDSIRKVYCHKRSLNALAANGFGVVESVNNVYR